MKIWLISQDANHDYDTYDSAVVIAETEDDARALHPSGFFDLADSWVSDRSLVKVELIGDATPGIEHNFELGVVCASFNAG